MTTYIRSHGKRLRWTVATLKEAGLDVERVDPGLNGNYYLAVDATADAVDRALANMEGYQRRRARKPIEVRAIQLIAAGGVIAAGLAALVAPMAGALMLALVAFAAFVLTQMRKEAQVMRQAGGRYRLFASVAMPVVLLLIAAGVIGVAGMAGMQIAAGNSALSLLGG